MGLSVPGGYGIEGMEGLGVEDMIVPRWDILQPTSRKDGTPGHFSLNLSGETRETVDAVILKISKTRVLWSGNPQDRVPECSSTDGVTGRTHGECAGCNFSLFDPTGVAKVCKQGYTYLCCDPENPEMLFLISMYGSSVSSAKVLNSQFLQKRRSPYTAVVAFKTVVKVGDKGKYFVHEPRITRWLQPAEFAPYQDLSRMMAGVAIREVEPEIVAEATHQAAPEPEKTVTWEELTSEEPKAASTTTAPKAGNGGGKRNLPF
jgi:hypothetical protein